jgi:threonyl-tRNA synthetase
VLNILKNSRIRCEIDLEEGTVEYKIRNAQLQKIPYMIVVGKKEKNKKTISVRTRDGKVIYDMKLEYLVSRIKKECSLV